MTQPIGPSDIDFVVRLSTTTLQGNDLDWSAKAGPLDWTRWELLAHMADDLFGYAAQLGVPNARVYVPFGTTADRPGAPDEAVHVQDGAGLDGALLVFESTGALLAAMVARASESARAHHVWGQPDRAGVAAMGIVEVLVHMNDLTVGTQTQWSPPPELCARILDRLFPDVEVGADPWESLLWATGRFESDERPKRVEWRWYGDVR